MRSPGSIKCLGRFITLNLDVIQVPDNARGAQPLHNLLRDLCPFLGRLGIWCKVEVSSVCLAGADAARVERHVKVVTKAGVVEQLCRNALANVSYALSSGKDWHEALHLVGVAVSDNGFARAVRCAQV